MSETSSQIEAHIREVQQDLSANLGELELRVKSAINWRRQFEAHTGGFLAAAFCTGLLLSLAGRRRR